MPAAVPGQVETGPNNAESHANPALPGFTTFADLFSIESALDEFGTDDSESEPDTGSKDHTEENAGEQDINQTPSAFMLPTALVNQPPVYLLRGNWGWPADDGPKDEVASTTPSSVKAWEPQDTAASLNALRNLETPVARQSAPRAPALTEPAEFEIPSVNVEIPDCPVDAKPSLRVQIDNRQSSDTPLAFGLELKPQAKESDPASSSSGPTIPAGEEAKRAPAPNGKVDGNDRPTAGPRVPVDNSAPATTATHGPKRDTSQQGEPDHALPQPVEKPKASKLAARTSPFVVPVEQQANPAERVTPVKETQAVAPLENEPQQAPSQPVNSVRIRLESADGARPVEVHVRQQDGDIRIAVRGSDSTLNNNLRQDLPELMKSLESQGYRAERWTPTEQPHEARMHAAGADNSPGNWSDQDRQQQRGQQDQQQQQEEKQNRDQARGRQGRPALAEHWRQAWAAENVRPDGRSVL